MSNANELNCRKQSWCLRTALWCVNSYPCVTELRFSCSPLKRQQFERQVSEERKLAFIGNAGRRGRGWTRVLRPAAKILLGRTVFPGKAGENLGGSCRQEAGFCLAVPCVQTGQLSLQLFSCLHDLPARWLRGLQG